MTNFYYHNASGQKIGPVNELQLHALVAQGVIGPQTQLETDSGHRGQAGQIPGLFPTPVAQQPFQPQPMPLQPQPMPQAPVKIIQNLNAYFKFYWISLVVGYPLMLVGVMPLVVGLSVAEQGGDSSIIFAFIGLGALLMMAGSTVLIASVVYMCLLLHQLWKLIPTDIARTTPGKAVGFLFIPFFNLYWMFVAYKGLGEDMNKTLQRYGVPYQVKETLGLIACILCCVAIIIPYIGHAPGLAGYIVQVFFFQSVKNGAIAMLERS